MPEQMLSKRQAAPESKNSDSFQLGGPRFAAVVWTARYIEDGRSNAIAKCVG